LEIIKGPRRKDKKVAPQKKTTYNPVLWRVRKERSKLHLPFYYLHFVTFNEDDVLPFPLRLIHFIWNVTVLNF
jgi:hypothetical protein